MRKRRFTEAQIIEMIKENEAGMATAEVCRKHGLNPATFHKAQAKYGGMNLSHARRLKAREGENANLATSVKVDRHGHYGGDAHDAPAAAHLDVIAHARSNAWRSPAHVEPEVGPSRSSK